MSESGMYEERVFYKGAQEAIRGSTCVHYQDCFVDMYLCQVYKIVH